MVDAIFENIASGVSGIFTAIGNAVTGATNLFYNPTSGMTTFGTLTLIGVGVSIAWLGFRWIKSLIKVKPE